MKMPLHALHPPAFTNSIDPDSSLTLGVVTFRSEPQKGMPYETPPTAPGHYSEMLSAIC